MSMETWRPFKEVATFRDMLDRFFEDPFEGRGLERVRPGVFGLPVDVVENEKGYELKASMPGFKPEDIQVEINQEVVTVKGEMKEEEHEEKRDNYVYKERRSGSFFRQVRLPAPVDNSKVEATLKDGILVLDLPKAAHVDTHKITVKPVK